MSHAQLAPDAPRPDFTFIMNDQYTYHTEADFRSSQALAFFRQYEQTQKKLRQHRSHLANLRDTYTQASTSERNRLAPDILKQEKELLQLEQEAHRLEKAVRKEENSAISGQ